MPDLGKAAYDLAGKNSTLVSTFSKAFRIIPGNNLFDISTITRGKALDSNGQPLTNTTYDLSDFIPVTPGKNIYFSINNQVAAVVHVVAFYDSSFQFVSKSSSSWFSSITVPSGVNYMRIEGQYSVYNQKFMVANDSIKTYAAYSATYIVDPYQITLRNYFTQIPAVVGKELNIYYETLFSAHNTDDLFCVVTCPTLASGSIYNLAECARITPQAGDVGTQAVTFSIYEKITGTLLISSSFNLVVKNILTLASPTKVMFIGDSWVDNGTIQTTVKDLFGTNFQLYGTRGTSPYFHEGRSGWSTQQYWNTQTYNSFTSPFYNPSSSNFDFAYYMTNNPSFNDVQYVVIHLGINDAWWSGLVTYMNNIISSIQAYNANIKVIVCSAPLAPPTNGGKAYVMSASWGKRTVQYAGNQLMFANFDNRQSGKVYIIPDKVNIDSVNDYPTETVAVSARNTTTVTRYTDNNHLATAGYQKVGDMFYYYLTWLFQQP